MIIRPQAIRDLFSFSDGEKREALFISGRPSVYRCAVWGQTYSATGQGRIIQRVRIPPRKVSQPPGSESLEGGR